jgi:pyridoxine/pyridoxamine 5'-phosphate oxidase
MKHGLDTSQDIRQQIWKELGRASVDRHHAWRTPVLATVGCDGSPNARTVVLRKVDANQHITGRPELFSVADIDERV